MICNDFEDDSIRMRFSDDDFAVTENVTDLFIA